ncbi:hypothetical protein GCM10027535_29910 [Mycolicibacterium hippocampi]|uniref:ANTAR domain-containing protein n=1 Tax=Mycolicibacterium hippocampi TaxID=659824 RepID=A0A7I9ZP79_9MYCO|nr:hypothetical protein MHIP_33440 [Mycolicibacterium hippocampi]
MTYATSRTDFEYVEMHGERIAYREAGSGEVVVLLHGMAGSSDSWQQIIPLLAHRYRVIAPDLLGHGRSDKPRSDYSLGAFAAGLRDLLDELDISRVTLVGHSLGGGVAMQFLYQHPEYCQRLVLVSSGGLGPDVGWILRLLSAPGAEFVLPLIAPNVVLAIGNRIRSWLRATRLGSPQAEQSWQAYSSLSDPPTRSAFLRTLRSVVDYRGQSVSALSRLRLRAETPTLVIWGDQDPIIPVDHGHAVHEARPNSTLTVLPRLGHFPHVEAPAEVAAAIDEFITGSRRDEEYAADQLPPTECGTGGGEDLPEVVLEQRSIIEGLVEDLEARQQTAVAVGLLMGLRGCSHTAADNEFRAAVDETGIAAKDLARALVAEASTDTTADAVPTHAHREQVQARWARLLAVRGRDDNHDSASIPAQTRVRFGRENEAMIC